MRKEGSLSLEVATSYCSEHSELLTGEQEPKKIDETSEEVIGKLKSGLK